MYEFSEYLDLVEKRILKNPWIAGWFKSYRDFKIDDLICKLLIYGHSRYYKNKNFILPRALIPSSYPYGIVAMLFLKEKYLDISFIDEVVNSVKNFMKTGKMITPDKVTWGIDIALVAIATYENIPDFALEYITVLDPNIYDQQMEIELHGKKPYKKIGLSLIDLNNEKAYSGNNLYSKYSRSFFNPRLSVRERIGRIFQH